MPAEAPIACWRCEQPGHAAADCDPPPAATRKELDRRIDRLVERWHDGAITTSQKRLWIQMESNAFKKEKAK